MLLSVFGINIILILLYNPLSFADNGKEAVSGPYISRIVNITKCEKPTRPYLKDSPIVVSLEIYNTSNNTLVRGNFTVKKDVKNVKQKAKGFVWQNNQWKAHSTMNEFDCRSMLLHFMYRACNITYDRKTCMFSKGNYFFKDIDINSIHHIWAYTLNYGKLKYRYELFDSKLGTYFCINFYMVTEPDNK